MLLFCGLTILSSAQSESKKSEIIADSKTAKAEFMKTDKEMQGVFDKAYGYVIFPNVGKGAVVVGGAAGNGVAYEGGKQIGKGEDAERAGKDHPAVDVAQQGGKDR